MSTLDILLLIASLPGAIVLAAWLSPRVRISVGAYLISSAEGVILARKFRARRYQEIVGKADKLIDRAVRKRLRQKQLAVVVGGNT